jgi:hypothetical protein
MGRALAGFLLLPALALAGLPPPIEISVAGAAYRTAWYSGWTNEVRSERALRAVGPDREGIDPITRSLRYSITLEQLEGPLARGRLVLAFWMDADSLRLGEVSIEKDGQIWQGAAFAMLSKKDGEYARVELVYERVVPRSWWREEGLSSGALPPEGNPVGDISGYGVIPFFVALEPKSESGKEWENKKRESFLLRFREEQRQ